MKIGAVSAMLQFWVKVTKPPPDNAASRPASEQSVTSPSARAASVERKNWARNKLQRPNDPNALKPGRSSSPRPWCIVFGCSIVPRLTEDSTKRRLSLQFLFRLLPAQLFVGLCFFVGLPLPLFVVVVHFPFEFSDSGHFVPFSIGRECGDFRRGQHRRANQDNEFV